MTVTAYCEHLDELWNKQPCFCGCGNAATPIAYSGK